MALSCAPLTEVVKLDSDSPSCWPAVPLKVFCTTCPGTVLVNALAVPTVSVPVTRLEAHDFIVKLAVEAPGYGVSIDVWCRQPAYRSHPSSSQRQWGCSARQETAIPSGPVHGDS